MKECKIKILTGLDSISRSYEDPACFDILAKIPDTYTILPGGRASIPTGIRTKIEFGYFVEILSKSGLSIKHGLEKGAGVIDSDYTGEWLIILYNHSKEKVIINNRAKIAQATVREKIKPIFIQVNELEQTERGDKGFGSSGK